MENVIRSVRDMTSADRLALEGFLGMPLSQDQKVSVRVLDLDKRAEEKAESTSESQQPTTLPEWCNVYQGLNENQVAEIESSIVRSYDSRTL